MKYLLVIFLSVLPIILLWKYINNLDPRKEPKNILLKLFLGGFLAIIITLVISYLLSFIFDDFFEYEVSKGLVGFLYTVLGIGLVEEFSKFLMLYVFGWNDKNLDETYDIILYPMIVSLGFAATENIMYSLDGGIATSIFRIFTAVPGHVFDGAFMGYFLYLYRMNSNKKNNLILAVLAPSLIHGIYDYIAFTAENVFDILVFIIFVVAEFIVAKKLIKNMAKNSIIFSFSEIFCSNCGTKIKTRFCPNCGKERQL